MILQGFYKDFNRILVTNLCLGWLPPPRPPRFLLKVLIAFEYPLVALSSLHWLLILIAIRSYYDVNKMLV